MTAQNWTAIPAGQHDIRLVVADMDGTLLDGDSEIPADFWPLLADMRERGIEFVPASGRQLATLRSMFADTAVASGGPGASGKVVSYIAENGNVVVADDEIVEVHGVGVDVTRELIDLVERAVASGSHDIGLVVCGLNTAYIRRRDAPFVAECEKYYKAMRVVDDLHDVLADVESGAETVLKLAIFDFGDAETMADALLGGVSRTHQVVVSGAHWVDIMNRETDKRRGVVALQRSLGVTPAQTAVFGDYLNDLQMLDAGEYSFAMANAHPELKAAARYVAPSNVEHGVIAVVRRLIG